MDGSSFDRLAREVATDRTRRSLVRGVGVALAVLGLGSTGRAALADLCKANGKACKKDDQCCSGHCGDSFCCQFGEDAVPCQADDDCCGGRWCRLSHSSVCVPPGPNGSACDRDLECSSGNCTFGKCADCDRPGHQC